MNRTSLETRIEAYNFLSELAKRGISRQETVNLINSKFNISKSTIYEWFRNKKSPLGRCGKIFNCKELFYVLGALLGDGYIYHWRGNYSVGILVKEENFAKKFARKMSKCIKRKVNAYCYAKRDLWFVKIGNFELFSFFKNMRNDPSQIFRVLEDNNHKETILELIEGFFDAEGCIKIIKEKARKTPKICLDITNTNYHILKVIRNLLEKTLNVEMRFSFQNPKKSWNRKVYHLRIYKKEFIQKFLESIDTIKVKPEKMPFVKKWLNN